jgi:proteasome maturation protein
VPGLHDTLRAALSPSPPTNSSDHQVPYSTHPLEARLLQWRQTQDAMKMESLRRIYGIAEPVRRGMELKIVRDGQWRPAVLGGSIGGNVHEDILVLGGRDTEVTWEDVFHGMKPPSILLLILRFAVVPWGLYGKLFVQILQPSSFLPLSISVRKFQNWLFTSSYR